MNVQPHGGLFQRFQTDPLSSLSPEVKSTITPASLQCMSCCGMSYFGVVTALVMITSLTVTLPTVYESEQLFIRVSVALFIFANIVVNFIIVSSRRSFYSGRQSDVDVLPGPDWKRCDDCDQKIPPRVHHCILCRRCIVSRDHHCFFTGSCVGRDNQRHFVAFCFHCCIGAGYSLYVAVSYVNTAYPDNMLVNYLLPVTILEWILGYESFGFLYFVCFLYICWMTCFGSGAILVWQTVVIILGVTTHEFRSMPRHLPKNVLRNVRAVCGPYWFLNFVCPLLTIQAGNQHAIYKPI